GQLSRSDLAGLRAGQTALLQPVQNFVTAMMGLLVPRSSRLAAGRDEGGLRRQTVRVAAAFAVLAVLLVAVVVPAGRLVVRHIPRTPHPAAGTPPRPAGRPTTSHRYRRAASRPSGWSPANRAPRS